MTPHLQKQELARPDCACGESSNRASKFMFLLPPPKGGGIKRARLKELSIKLDLPPKKEFGG
jgi:hypothetical protein